MRFLRNRKVTGVSSLIGILGVVFALVGGVAAQESDIQVGDLPFPKLEWGQQTYSFEITNDGDWLKFVTVVTNIGDFEGSYAHARRTTKQHFILEPGVVTTCNATLDFPGNYGLCTLWVKVYDVVDTLDDPEFGELVLNQPFHLNFRTPEMVLKYRQEPILSGPGMERARAIDSEISRLLLLLLAEGRSADDVARITNSRPEFVKSIVDELLTQQLLERGADGVLKPKVAVIPFKEAEGLRKVATNTADELAEIIRKNLPAMESVIDSMVATGSVTADGQGSFLEGSNILFHRLPLIGGLLLWYDLGDKFIVDGKPGLSLFGSGGLCQPSNGIYTYLVHGSPYFNGTQYFEAFETTREDRIVYCPTVPETWCTEDALTVRKRLYKGTDWDYVDTIQPEAFYFDTAVVHPALRALSAGADKVMNDAAKELKADGPDAAGRSYWFWNLVATLTFDRLLDAGVLHREESDIYHLMRRRL